MADLKSSAVGSSATGRSTITKQPLSPALSQNRFRMAMDSKQSKSKQGHSGKGQIYPTYTVSKGDTIHALGKRLKIDPQKIINLNRNTIQDPNKIYPGNKIKLPQGNDFSVPKNRIEIRSGDSLSGIARQQGITTDALFNANKDQIVDRNKIYPGMVLNIPGGNNVAPSPQDTVKSATERANAKTTENTTPLIADNQAKAATPADNTNAVKKTDPTDKTQSAEQSKLALLGQLLKPQAGVIAVKSKIGGKEFLLAVLPPTDQFQKLARSGFSDEKAFSDLLENSTVFLSTKTASGKPYVVTGNLGTGTIDYGKPLFLIPKKVGPVTAVFFGNKRIGGADMNNSPAGKASLNEGVIFPLNNPEAQGKYSKALSKVAEKMAAADFTSFVDSVPVIGKSPLGYAAKKLIGKYAARPAAKRMMGKQIREAMAKGTYFVGLAYQQGIKFDPQAGSISISGGGQSGKISIADALDTLTAKINSIQSKN